MLNIIRTPLLTLIIRILLTRIKVSFSEFHKLFGLMMPIRPRFVLTCLNGSCQACQKVISMNVIAEAVIFNIPYK